MHLSVTFQFEGTFCEQGINLVGAKRRAYALLDGSILARKASTDLFLQRLENVSLEIYFSFLQKSWLQFSILVRVPGMNHIDKTIINYSWPLNPKILWRILVNAVCSVRRLWVKRSLALCIFLPDTFCGHEDIWSFMENVHKKRFADNVTIVYRKMTAATLTSRTWM